MATVLGCDGVARVVFRMQAGGVGNEQEEGP